MFTNERNHVGRPFDASESRIEDQLRYTSSGLNLRLQNVRLQRVKEALVQQLGWHLVCHSTRSLDEHLVGNSRRQGCVDRHSDGREDVEAIGLPRQECLPIQVDRWKLNTGCIDGLPLGPCIGLLGCALGFLGRVRKSKNYRALVDARNALDDMLRKSTA